MTNPLDQRDALSEFLQKYPPGTVAKTVAKAHDSDMQEIRTILGRLEPKVTEMHAVMTATLPHLATKTEVSKLEVALSEKPSKSYLWMVLGVLVAAILGTFALK